MSGPGPLFQRGRNSTRREIWYRARAVIEVENVTKRYGDREVVRDVSFRVAKSEIVGFLGPNGAGKTTTLRMLCAYLPATSGRIDVAGCDVLEDPVGARRAIGYLPENTPLYPEMRVGEYLSFRATLKKVPGKDRKKSVDAAMEQARVADHRDRIIGQLSKGYRQRVGLADALVARPPILVLDEPTVGLDPNQIRQTRDLVRSLGADHTILLSTHILPEVEAVCGRVVIIHKGRIVGEGSPAELENRMKGSYTLHVEGRGDGGKARAGLGAIGGVQDAVDREVPADRRAAGIFRIDMVVDAKTDVRDDVFRAAVDGGWVLREMRGEQMTLEDVFADLTTTEEAPPEPAEPEKKDAPS
jgi:ABC-2 type transport system ATP-binding protein